MIKPDEQSVTEIETEASIITLTPVAADKVRELLAQENDETLGLRIFVAGGGCSGLQYGMTLDVQQPPDDVVIPIKHKDGDFHVFIDDMSLGYITGSEVDYVDSLMASGFTVNNPNAVSSCGCGQSFKTESAGAPGSCGCR
jgi:iron-sulfur cluster assembly accessory protein